jgi:RNA polymerase subunit RPABC4/transcription elongation factor Spt4
MTPLRTHSICRKCRVLLEFHSAHTTAGPDYPREVAVFACTKCGRLTAEEQQQQLKAA